MSIASRKRHSKTEFTSMRRKPLKGVAFFKFFFQDSSARGCKIQSTACMVFAVSGRSGYFKNVRDRLPLFQLAPDEFFLVMNRTKG